MDVYNLNTAVGDFQRDYLYKMVLESYPSLVDDNFSGAADVAKGIDFYNEKGIFPESKNKLIKIPWAGQYLWVDGPNDDAGQGVLSFYLDTDWNVYKFWKAWKNLSGDESSGASYPNPLKEGTLICYMVSVDKTTITQGVKLEKVKVNHVQNISMDKGGSGVVKFNVNISWVKRKAISGGGNV